MNRLNQFLSAILVVQLGLVGWFVFYPTMAQSEVETGPLFPEFDPEAVTQIVINDDQGNEIALTKEGEEWVLPTADDFPVAEGNVGPLLEKINAVENNRRVTETEASHGRLNVAENEFSRKLELITPETSRVLYMGSSGGAGSVHVRAGDQAEVYLTNELATFDVNVQPSGWIDTLYFTVPQTAPTTITLENENGTLEFERTEEDSWTLSDLDEEETFNEAAMSSLLNQVTSIRMTAPLGQEAQESYNLDAPQAVVTIETEDESYTFEIGAQNPDDNSYIMKASSSPYYVSVAQFTGDNLVDKSRADFIEQPPEEGDGAAGSTDDLLMPVVPGEQ